MSGWLNKQKIKSLQDLAVPVQVWNLRCLTSPAMVAYPTTVTQISNIVKCGQKYGVQVVPRGGAHSYE